MLISVIVPIYKTEKFIARCIESIINQTYNNLEIILVNDGSPDRCGSICDEYALKDDRIRVIHKENGGISDARNSGLSIAKGEFIGLVDSDDYIHPKMYEILIEGIKKHNLDIAICREKYTYTYEIDEINEIPEFSVFNNFEAINRVLSDETIPYIIVWNKLYRRTLFSEISYPKGKIYEDERTTYKLLFISKKIGYIDTNLYYYYQSMNSFIRVGFNIGRMEFSEAMEERIEFFKEKGLNDFYEIALKRYNLWLYSFHFDNYSDLKEYGLEEIIIEKKKEYTLRILKEIKQPFLVQNLYRLMLLLPRTFELLAFHRVYRSNIVSKIAKQIFYI